MTSFARLFLLQQRHEEFFSSRTHGGNVVNTVKKVMVFRELHADGNPHFYGIILCDKPGRTNDIAAALKSQDKVFLSFGIDHLAFWTAVVYGGVPSVHKGVAELDKDPYHTEGKTLREELLDIPMCARKAERERVQAYLGVFKPNPTKGLSVDDLHELIRENQWRGRKEVLAAAKARKDAGDPAGRRRADCQGPAHKRGWQSGSLAV